MANRVVHNVQEYHGEFWLTDVVLHIFLSPHHI